MNTTELRIQTAKHGHWLLVLLLAALPFLSVGCRSGKPAGPAFDVPSLVGRKIGTVENILAIPAAERAPLPTGDKSGETGTSTVRKGEYVLALEYLKRSGRVTALTLSYADPTHSIKEDNKGQLLKVGNLSEDAKRYTIEYLEDPQKALYITGLRITPASITHTVTLRVLGGASMTSVMYQAPVTISNEIPPGQPFMTIPPWDAQLTASTGAEISIEAGPAGNLQVAPSGSVKTTVIIEVDGKIAKQFTSSGGVAHCSVELD
jgi:hypothetical protein